MPSGPVYLSLPYCDFLLLTVLQSYGLALLMQTWLIYIVSVSQTCKVFPAFEFCCCSPAKNFPQLLFLNFVLIFFIMADLFLSFRTFHEPFLLSKVNSRLLYLSAYSSPSHILMLFYLVPAIA